MTIAEPYYWGGKAYWSRSSWGWVADALPDEVFALLPDHGLSNDARSMRGFDTRDLALAALSDACVRYGRAEAKKIKGEVVTA